MGKNAATSDMEVDPQTPQMAKNSEEDAPALDTREDSPLSPLPSEIAQKRTRNRRAKEAQELKEAEEVACEFLRRRDTTQVLTDVSFSNAACCEAEG